MQKCIIKLANTVSNANTLSNVNASLAMNDQCCQCMLAASVTGSYIIECMLDKFRKCMIGKPPSVKSFRTQTYCAPVTLD